MRGSIRFLRKGHVVELTELKPTALLLDYLRDQEGVTGTKNGCREGQCGACMVALGRVREGKLIYRPATSCTQLLATLDATEVVTIEDIAGADGSLHPLQRAFLDHGAVQCGFCTPGMIMSLFPLFQNGGPKVDRLAVEACIAGNLCRCTGYLSILEAATAALAGERPDRHRQAREDTTALLQFLDDGEDVLIGDEQVFFASPVGLERFGEFVDRHPAAAILAGGTDVGAGVAEGTRDDAQLISLGRVADLCAVKDLGREISIGAGTTYDVALPHLEGIDADLGDLVRRVGGPAVRASATIGGAIAGGAAGADIVPALLTLGTRLELRRGRRGRWLALEDFYLGDGGQHRAPGEYLATINVSKLAPTQLFRCYKLARRVDQDTAIVTGAFRLTIANGTIFEARIAFSGMGLPVRRASATEAALKGSRIGDTEAWGAAFEALKSDFTPGSDLRASARYRGEIAQALLGKALIETAGTSSERTRLTGVRDGTGHAAD